MAFKKSINIVGFAGFTKNPEQKEVNNNIVANVPVGFNIGENENVFAQLTFWGNDAKTILEKYKAGDQFYIEGSISRLSAYVNKQNTPAVNLNISVTGWRCVHKKSSSNNNANNGYSNSNGNYSNNNYQQNNNQNNNQQWQNQQVQQQAPQQQWQQNQPQQTQQSQQWQPQQQTVQINQPVQQTQQTQTTTVSGGLPFEDEDLPF